jgi:hypothetical protein
MLMAVSTHFGHQNIATIIRCPIGMYSVLIRSMLLDFINILSNMIFSLKSKNLTLKSTVY